jgi:hypothetical protein
MSERLSILGLLVLPGTVAGMMLAGVLLVISDALFPETFREFFPLNTPFFVLAVAIALASTIGLLNLVLSSRSDEPNSPVADRPKRSRDKITFPPGGADVF